MPAEPAKSDEKKPDEKKKKSSISSIFSKDKKKKGDKDWTCSASLVFESGRLVQGELRA